MSLIEFDIGGNFKELGVLKEGIIMGYGCLPPKTTNLVFKQSGTQNIQGINRNNQLLDCIGFSCIQQHVRSKHNKMQMV